MLQPATTTARDVRAGALVSGGVRPTSVQPSANALLGLLVLAKLLVHLLVAGNYGYFRDELYYLAAGRHLQWGYVDFPPLVAVLAALVDQLSGASLVALHVLPALAGALLVLLTGLLARDLGGGRLAQALAALASLVAGTFLAAGSLFSMDAWDQLWWTLGALVLVRLLRRDEPRLWLLFGLVAGLGLLTKLTMLAFGFAVVVGLLLTPFRRHLGTPWPWLGGVVAGAFLVPYALWNAANGWPTPEFWSHYGGKLVGASPLEFLVTLSYTMNPLTLPLWLAGLASLLRGSALRPYRALGWAFVVLLVLLALAGAKVYFLAPAFPPLFAAGGLAAERLARGAGWRRVLGAYSALLVVAGLWLAPIVMPVLPPATFGQFYGFLGSDGGARLERHRSAVLPQWLADRFGWPELVATVADAYAALPPADQAQACIVASNYGEASALVILGRAGSLPPVISGHNSWYLWGPGACTGQVTIVVGASRQSLEATFDAVAEAGVVRCAECMPYEDQNPVFVARGLRQPVAQVWPQLKHFD